MARITVTPADEDEVIVAGARDAHVPDSVLTFETATAVQEESAAQIEFVAPVEKPGQPEQVGESRSEALPKQAEMSEQSPTPSAHPKRTADEYHETTLEDLESSRMPLAQKVVIVAAVVCIIGALIYYFVVMR